LSIIALSVDDAKSIAEARLAVEALGLRSIDILVNNAGIATANHPLENVLNADPVSSF